MSVCPESVNHILHLDIPSEVERITTWIRKIVHTDLRRKGAVVGVSGGIDSSVVAYLCARALGSDRVIALFTPESDSSSESLTLGREVAGRLGVKNFLEDISPILSAARCYERRDEAVRNLFPKYGPGWKMKIVLPAISEPGAYSLFSLVVKSPAGELYKSRMTIDAYLGVLAATNFKQRTRKMIEYYYADRFNCAVAGTPNFLEYDQGFFVKNGDGSADFKPIAHLYKTQIYRMAEYLGVPEEIRKRPPTTDTYSLEQTQEEFYFSVSLEKMDICLFGYVHGISIRDISRLTALEPEQVERIFASIEAKRKAAKYLHAQPFVVEQLGVGKKEMAAL